MNNLKGFVDLLRRSESDSNVVAFACRFQSLLDPVLVGHELEYTIGMHALCHLKFVSLRYNTNDFQTRGIDALESLWVTLHHHRVRILDDSPYDQDH